MNNVQAADSIGSLLSFIAPTSRAGTWFRYTPYIGCMPGDMSEKRKQGDDQ
jgi:hypothetical protein